MLFTISLTALALGLAASLLIPHLAGSVFADVIYTGDASGTNLLGINAEPALLAFALLLLATLRQLRAEGWKSSCIQRGAKSIRNYLVDAGISFDELNQNSAYETGGYNPVATIY